MMVGQEAMLWRRFLVAADDDARNRRTLPTPLTGALRLRLAEEPRLRLGPVGRFDPAQPSVAVAVEFLGGRRDLPDFGVFPAVQAGDLFFGWANLRAVRDLAEHPATVRIDSLRPWLYPNAGIQGGGACAPAAAAAAGGVLTGQGVLLASTDLGFDFLHPDFQHTVPGGEAPRARWLHDLRLPPPPGVPSGAMGRRFTHGDLQLALDWFNYGGTKPAVVTEHFDNWLVNPPVATPFKSVVQQHGTAVLGIAAGNGRGAGPMGSGPVGVAPGAELLLISVGTHDQMRFAESLELFRAFETAFSEPGVAPCVAMMANSDNQGPHDGSLSGERFLDELLLEPGRAIVLTAGNLNHQPNAPAETGVWHSVAMPDATGTATLELSYVDGAAWPDSAEIWFRPPPGAAVTARVGSSLVNPAVPVADGGAEVEILKLSTAGNIKQTRMTARLQRDDFADAHCLWLTFLPAVGRAIAPVQWTITVPATGPVHGWLDRNNGALGRWRDMADVNAGANLTTLGAPSAATRPLTVGSVREAGGIVTPSYFSGRGPARGAAAGVPSKPDLVAVGEEITAPHGDPNARAQRQHPSATGNYKLQVPGGTSYAAPQVAGACALLFEHFGQDPLLGSPATWDDLRDAILTATVRLPNMPPAGPEGWEPVCGHGLLRPDAVQPQPSIGALRLPQAPAEADLWLARSADDQGEEPFVAWRFWDSSALALLDARGQPLDPAQVAVGEAEPAALRLRVRNRGGQDAMDVEVAAWWAPLGALHPLPGAIDRPGGAWRADGFSERNVTKLPRLAAGKEEDVVLRWGAPRDEEGRMLPHQLLGVVATEADPYEPDRPICATNNLAVLSVAAVRRGAPMPPFTIIGSVGEPDGAILWPEDGRSMLRIEGLPVTALPWREAAIFAQTGVRERPLCDGTVSPDDAAARRNADLTGGDVEERTDIRGARRLVLRDGLVTVEGGPKLVLPRLRITPGAVLEIHATAADPNTPGAIHLLHLSGGRRVGGGTIRHVG